MNIDIVQELRNQADLAHAVTGCSLRNHPLTKAADEIESLRQQINDLVSAHAITSMQTEQPAVAEVRCRNGEVFGYIGRQVFRDMLPLGTKLYTHANQSTPVDGHFVITSTNYWKCKTGNKSVVATANSIADAMAYLDEQSTDSDYTRKEWKVSESSATKFVDYDGAEVRFDIVKTKAIANHPVTPLSENVQDGWISVKDKMPPVDMKVLVRDSVDVGFNISDEISLTVATFVFGKWEDYKGEPHLYATYITHWQHLPKFLVKAITNQKAGE